MASARTSERLEAYLTAVRANLRGLSEPDVAEILAELHSHVLDFTGGDLSDAKVALALDKLGEPQEIARINLSMRVAAESLGRRSPWAVMWTIWRLARLSARGFVTFLISFVGYGLALSFLLTAVVKPFAPDRAGFWAKPDSDGGWSYSFGIQNTGFTGHDLLGWWIVPLGLVLGLAFGYLTYLYDVRAIRRMAQRRREWAL